MRKPSFTFLRYPVAIIIGFAMTALFFFAVPVVNVLCFGTDKGAAKIHTEPLMDVEMNIREKKPEQHHKTIRTLNPQQNKFQMTASHNAAARAQNFQMDLGLARGSLADGGDGVAVGGGEGGVNNVVYEAGDVDEEAQSINEVNPQYPERAKKLGVSGYVKVYLVIDVYGNVTQSQVVSVDPPGYGFETAALTAIRQWKFEPAKLGGYPVAQKATKEFKFVR